MFRPPADADLLIQRTGQNHRRHPFLPTDASASDAGHVGTPDDVIAQQICVSVFDKWGTPVFGLRLGAICPLSVRNRHFAVWCCR